MRLPAIRSRCRFALALTLLTGLISVPGARAASHEMFQGAGSRRAAPAHSASARLICTPAKLQFGPVAVGQSSAQRITVTNFGNSGITLSRAIMNGEFGIRGLNFPLTLASGESFTFFTYFAPRDLGDTSGSLSLVTDSREMAQGLILKLAGTGTAKARLTVTLPQSDFGEARLGTRVIRVGTIAATNSAMTITAAESSSPEFVLRGLSFPVTIPAGQERQFTVTFEPRAQGTADATLSFRSNDGNSSTTQSMRGIGVIGPPTAVYLSWRASHSRHVMGYNVFRSMNSGGPYTKINFRLDPRTKFVDARVGAGNTYYYVTTAVDSHGHQSAPSNEVAARVLLTQ